MKKVIFAVLAAFMVSLSFISCSKSPEEQMVSCIKDAVSLLKDTKIKSADDAKKFEENAKALMESFNKIAESVKGQEKSELSEEENKKLEAEAVAAAKELTPEIERIEKEASEAGVDVSKTLLLFQGLAALAE